MARRCVGQKVAKEVREAHVLVRQNSGGYARAKLGDTAPLCLLGEECSCSIQ